MSELTKLEYRVKAKTVYFITRFCQFGEGSASITEEGEFRDALSAQRAAMALCEAEAKHQGCDRDDPRIIFPEPLEFSPIPE